MGRTIEWIYVTDNYGNQCVDNDLNLIVIDFRYVFTKDDIFPLHVSEVSVRIVNGVFRPCNQCHWFSTCVVPKGVHLQHAEKGSVREYYHCLDYTSKTP